VPRYVAFLRAINVGGHVVKMSELKAVFAGMGLSGVETFIASGNVLFETKATKAVDAALLEKKIGAALERALGYEVATFLRTDAEIVALAKYEAFAAEKVAAARAHCVGFLAAPLAGVPALAAMKKFESDEDTFHVRGREVFWLCTTGQGNSKFNNARFERSLGLRATWRNVRTVSRLAARLRPAGAAQSPS
jgi:uncharacterized protein (DUF1697 family)